MAIRVSGRTPQPKINSDFVYDYEPTPRKAAAKATKARTPRIMKPARKSGVAKSVKKPVPSVATSAFIAHMNEEMERQKILNQAKIAPIFKPSPDVAELLGQELPPSPDYVEQTPLEEKSSRKGRRNSKTSNGSRRRAKSHDPHPGINLATLTVRAILSVPSGLATLPDIYDYYLNTYPYYEHCPTNWRNSIRHQLSLNKLFEKIPKEGRGSYWVLNRDLLAEHAVYDSNGEPIIDQRGAGLMERKTKGKGRRVKRQSASSVSISAGSLSPASEMTDESFTPLSSELWPTEVEEEKMAPLHNNRVLRQLGTMALPMGSKPVEYQQYLIPSGPKTLQYKVKWEERLVAEHPTLISALNEPTMCAFTVPLYGQDENHHPADYSDLPKPLEPTFIDSMTKASELMFDYEPTLCSL